MNNIYFFKRVGSERIENIIEKNIKNFEYFFNLIPKMTKDQTIEPLCHLVSDGKSVEELDVQVGGHSVFNKFMLPLFKTVLERNGWDSINFLNRHSRYAGIIINNEYNKSFIEISLTNRAMMTLFKFNEDGFKILFVPEKTKESIRKFDSIDIFVSFNADVIKAIRMDEIDLLNEHEILLNNKQLDYLILLSYFIGNDRIAQAIDDVIDKIIEEDYDTVNNYFHLKMMEHI